MSANSDVVANTSKVGITQDQADAITANTAKVGYTDALVSANSDVVANTAKVGITQDQADAITANTAKVGYTDALVSANSDVVANTAKVGITQDQADAITLTLQRSRLLKIGCGCSSQNVQDDAITANSNIKYKYEANTVKVSDQAIKTLKSYI